MGTSISQPSPRTTNWSPVNAGYQNKFISEDRIINEIWRACENEDIPVSEDIKSKAIFECFSAVKKSINSEQALTRVNSFLLANKNNSMIAEFAKRAIVRAFSSDQPTKTWTTGFFAEITNYIISRDASGFVGNKYRNKTVNELISFKKNIYNKVSAQIYTEAKDFKNLNDWNKFVDKSINKLKSGGLK